MEKAVEINNEAVQHFLNSRFEKAENCYRKALELDPKNVSALNNMGLLYHQQKEYRTAIEYFEKAIQITSKETYYINAGNAAACLSEAEEAESWYGKALEANPGSVNAKQCLANLYQYNNRYKDAAPIWADLIRSTGKEKFTIEYAQNLMQRNKYHEAADMLYNSVSEDWGRVWFLLGMCEYHMKNYGLAKENFKKGLGIDPDDENMRHYLAVTYLASGEADKGIQQLDKILKMNPGNFKVLTEKGVILLSRNLPDRALKLFDQSLDIQPGYEKAEKYKNMALKMEREKTNAKVPTGSSTGPEK